MSGMDQQTLQDLEFTQIQEWLAGYGHTLSVQERLLNLPVLSNFEQIKSELAKTKEFHSIRTENESFPSLEYQELTKEIKILPIRNAVLEQEGFVRIFQATELTNQILHFFDKRETDFPSLNSLLSHVYFTKEISDAIEKVFDRKGTIKDDASPALFAIRQQIAKVKMQINKNFDREMRKLVKEGILGDTKETYLNDRRVLTVVSTHKRKISGSVLGTSKTGSLTFIEPQVNVELNQEYEQLKDDERKEIFRILQALTREIAHFLPLIKAYQTLLTELDFIQAKVRLAIELNADLPNLVEEPRIELIDAFHPILWRNNKNSGKKTLAQNLILDKFSRMLVISGPNAGGKSITLKTIGLIQLMLQAGLLVPVHPNSQLGLFQSILSDIGDNQSIENELSTYSYRLKRMQHFLNIANRRTLLLLDEFGTGSDPDLGGALAEVFFEHLYAKKCFGVVTTHYANIKLKADQLRNAVNGCMLFNTETLEPLFKFSMGQPGSSFTFEVAQINGISLEIIEEAKTKLSENKVKMDRLLSELQREKNYLERLNKEHISAQESAQKARIEFTERKEKLDDRLANLTAKTEVNNQFVILGKKMKTFIDRYQTKTRKKDANQALLEEMRKYLMLEKSKREEVKLKEKLKMEASRPAPKKVKNNKKKEEVDPYQQDKIVLGSSVKLIETKQNGTVEEIKGSQLTVSFGFLRMKVEREKLMFLK